MGSLASISCWGFCFLCVILSCFAAQVGFEISPAVAASQMLGYAHHHALKYQFL
ncbi:hypothetical protein I79_003284 [Cricetulus griseus]|uniref:Uncharacterized protein n=1 Tax=Cricetulus griseus TaxID=10029 RepID=G3GZK9_CRIGR|nr:hypothetical protein I79_003284 [Cricetulus griseus]